MKISISLKLILLVLLLTLNYNLSAQTNFNIAVGASLSKHSYNRTVCRRWGCDTFSSANSYGGILFNPRVDFDVDSIAAMSFSSYIKLGKGKFEVPLMIELHAGNRKKFQVFAGGGFYAGYYNLEPHSRVLFGPQVDGGVEFNLLKQRFVVRYSFSKSYMRGYSTDFHKQQSINACIYLNHK